MTLKDIPNGTYIACVSGGVDSVVLLDLAAKAHKLKIIVAHFDHGIRPDSAGDAEFVRDLASRYGLEYELGSGNLGPDASEEEARTARYAFLHECSKKHGASSLLLAHHRDDVIETVILNLLRGTGWRGVSSMRSLAPKLRPFLGSRKDEILAYAKDHDLEWREDSTNTDQKYLRNYIRLTLLPKMRLRDQDVDNKLFALYRNQTELIGPISHESARYLKSNVVLGKTIAGLSRYELIMMPPEVAIELLQSCVSCLAGQRLLTEQAQRLLAFAKAAHDQKTMEVARGIQAYTAKRQLIVEVASGVLS